MKRKILTGLLSFAIALGLWMYVVTVVSPNSDNHYYNIPVTLQGEVILQERGLMVTITDLPTVSLHLEGNRTDLNKLNSSNITIAVDVSRIGEAGTHSLTYVPSYPGDVPNNAITVLERNPGSITLQVEERISKNVPVDVQYKGTLSEDYMADKENKILNYEQINITGPKSVIDKIAMARIEVDIDGRVESIKEQFRYTLCDEKGTPVDAKLVTTDVESVELTLRIVRVKEILLTVNVINGGGATKDTSVITIEPKTIRVSGSDALLENLESLELGVINLGEMTTNEILYFPIKLPEGVTNETGVVEAQVDVKLPDLATKTLVIKQFQTMNVPNGLRADIFAKQLEIQIRGPKAAIEQCSEKDVSVMVDFTNKQEGTDSVKADIIIGVDGVGAVGTYFISATLHKTR